MPISTDSLSFPILIIILMSLTSLFENRSSQANATIDRSLVYRQRPIGVIVDRGLYQAIQCYTAPILVEEHSKQIASAMIFFLLFYIYIIVLLMRNANN